MISLDTTLYGIPIKSPLVVGSSGLTNSIQNVLDYEKSGAGAVILKSIFEEEILIEHEQMLKNAGRFDEDFEFLDYFDYQLKDEKLNKYIQYIKTLKEQVSIPVLASINCITVGEWIPFAREVEKAGVDGIELNIMPLPSDITKSSLEYEKEYTRIVQSVKSAVSIPVGVKIGMHFTSLGTSIKRLSELSEGITLFNRTFKPDIDITTFALKAGPVLTGEGDVYLDSLRWVYVMKEQCGNKMHASSGIDTGEKFIKLLLAGASSCQLVSAIYRQGPQVIVDMLRELQNWMEEHKLNDIAEIHKKLERTAKNNEYLMRSQFLTYFGSHEPNFH